MTTTYATYKRVIKHADTLTPVGIFKRLSGEKKFLLESSFQHETKGKFSFIGANPYMEIIGQGKETTTIDLATKKKRTYDIHALQFMKEHLPKIEIDLPLSFTGGAIGYVAYDVMRQFLDIGKDLPNDLEMPDIHFMVYDTIVVYEHRTEKAHILSINVHDEPEAKLEEKIAHIEQELDQTIEIAEPVLTELAFRAEIDQDTFIENVARTKKHIEQGEAEQIVISQRFIAELDCDPFSFYRKLRTANPSPYMFYVDFTDYLIVGASPESLVQTAGRDVVTNPIAGTRPRGKSAAEDAALLEELLNDAKEVAEHKMLVDLSKRDLEAICPNETIDIPVYMDIVKYEHVMHIVSEVHGTLKEDMSSIDALIACLPAGTVSGSPKERAMQIINEIETVRRGVYAGGIGFISFAHDINLAIAIRSLVIKDGRAYAQTGAGIVADSVPEMEFYETLQKAKSLTNL